jgi:hypothetical protein
MTPLPLDLRRPCVHLGETLRLAGQGEPRVKIHACAVHGSCTVGRQLPGTSCCDGCPDRRGA